MFHAKRTLAIIDAGTFISVVARRSVGIARVGDADTLIGGFIARSYTAGRIIKPGAVHVGARLALMLSIACLIAVAEGSVITRRRSGNVGRTFNTCIELFAASTAAKPRNASGCFANR
jgi:hypothetical protein